MVFEDISISLYMKQNNHSYETAFYNISNFNLRDNFWIM